MAKKKHKKQIKSVVSLVSAILGIVAVIMLFLPAVAIKNTETTYSGLRITFGYSENNVTVFNFSIMNLITYLLVVAGVLFTLLGMLGKGSKFATFIAAAAFIVAGVFFFLSVAFCSPNGTASSIIGFFGVNIKDSLTLAYGSIIGGVVSLIAGLCAVFNIISK